MFATLSLPAGHELPAPQGAPTVRVRSADELCNALRRARARALTLDGSGMDRVLRIDAARGLIEVQAATSWAVLAAQLAPHGVPLEPFARLSALPATVGEAVSLAAAGPDGLPVAAHVTALTLATPDGELRRADRDANRELLKTVLGGQGVIGVLYSLTLSVESLRRSAASASAAVELDIPAATAPRAAAWSARYLLPPDQLDAFLKDVRALVEERRPALLGISVRRYLPDASCRLNWATREWAGVQLRFGIRTTVGASVGATEVRRLLLAAALARGGSFPISEARDATRSQLALCYPMLGEFLAEKRCVDPAGRLHNAWYRDMTAKLRTEPCDVRWGRA